jgi:hyaluronan synthase
MPATATPVRTYPSPSTELIPGPPSEPLVIETAPPAVAHRARGPRSRRAWLVVLALMPALALGAYELSQVLHDPVVPGLAGATAALAVVAVALASTRARSLPAVAHGTWPLVSVLVRSGEGIEEVARTIRSALACGYPRLEVCIVEDGTVAGLRGHLARLARQETRIRVVTLAEPATARAELLSAARKASGDIWAFVEPGATVTPATLERAVRSIVLGNAPGMVTGGFVWLSNGKAEAVNRYTIAEPRGRRVVTLRDVLYDVLMSQLAGEESSRPSEQQPARRRARQRAPRFDRAYRATFILAGIAVFLLLIVTKSGNLGSRKTTLPLLVYTIFVTSFELSRLAGAVFFPRVRRRLAKGPRDTERAVYEPTISFVVPCMNEEGAIEKTIMKCLEADYPAEKVEVIVVNDGSTDTTLGALLDLADRYDRLTIVDWRVNRGKRHGMAEGFRRASGEIIVQLDSDSYIEPATLRALVQPFRNAEVGAVCAHADPENADSNVLTKMQAAYYFMSFRIMKAAESSFMAVFCCSGCSSAYRRSVVMPVIDEWLAETFLGKPVTWGDDRALTNRVLKAGYKTTYTDEARAYTICPENMKQLLKQQVRWKKGWFVNSMFATPFVLKQYPFVGLTYFFPLILLTLVTPFMAVRAFLYGPIFSGVMPTFYFAGVLVVASLITIYYRLVARENKYWPYLLLWSALNMVVLSFILFYALLTIQNRRWGTR